MDSYYKRWAAGEGGSKRNERRRKRYREDPAYREAVIQQKQTYRQKSMVERLQQEAAAVDAGGSRNTPEWQSRLWVNPEGKSVVVFTTGALEAATRAGGQALRQWEARGLIPGPSHRDENGCRFYTVDRIQEVIRAMEVNGLKPRAPRDERKQATITLSSGVQQTVILQPVTVMAKALGRSVATLSLMEAKGVLPPTPFKLTSRQRRYYTEDQIRVAVAALAETAAKHSMGLAWALRSPEACAEFHAAVRAAWAPLEGATVEIEGGDGEHSGEQRDHDGGASVEAGHDE